MIIVIDDIIGIWHIYISIMSLIVFSIVGFYDQWHSWSHGGICGIIYIYIPMGLYNVIFPKISLIVWNEIPYQWDYIRNVNGQPASKLDKRQDSDELVNG